MGPLEVPSARADLRSRRRDLHTEAGVHHSLPMRPRQHEPPRACAAARDASSALKGRRADATCDLMQDMACASRDFCTIVVQRRSSHVDAAARQRAYTEIAASQQSRSVQTFELDADVVWSSACPYACSDAYWANACVQVNTAPLIGSLTAILHVGSRFLQRL